MFFQFTSADTKYDTSLLAPGKALITLRVKCDSDNINNNNNFYLNTAQIKANTADRVVQIFKYIIMIKNFIPKRY